MRRFLSPSKLLTARGLRTGMPILIGAVVACGGASERDQKPAAATTFPFAERVGWLHGSCLAILNSSLSSGTPVVLVIMGDPQAVQQGRIIERTEAAEKCQPLMEGRAALNTKRGTSFYALETAGIRSTDMGIGIVSPSANPEVVNGLARVDLDQNSQSEVFSSCATTEGIKFAVWTAKAYAGEPRWTGYYYLDYESKPTCP